MLLFLTWYFVLVSTIQPIWETTLCVRDLNTHRGSCTWSMPALLRSIQHESRRKWRCYKEASDPERPARYQTSETDGTFLHTTTSYNHPKSPREAESCQSCIVLKFSVAFTAAWDFFSISCKQFWTTTGQRSTLFTERNGHWTSSCGARKSSLGICPLNLRHTLYLLEYCVSICSEECLKHFSWKGLCSHWQPKSDFSHTLSVKSLGSV